VARDSGRRGVPIPATVPAMPRGSQGVEVEFRHVTKRYSSSGPPAVDDLSLTVPAGEVAVLVGPSGCGKTTSLKLVNRLVEPTSGQVLIEGRDVATEDPVRLRRGIGYVIQQVGLFPHLTVGENVAVVPVLLGWDERRRQERTEELLALVGLESSYLLRYPHELSGGERQRVGVARALAADPPLLLMDEPFGAVDPIVRERLQNEFLRLQGELGKTVLFVTHDIDEAIKLGDRVAVMAHRGHVAQYAPPEELLAQPASDFVARFVGSDRGLKRLSLMRVRDLPLRMPPTAHVGDDGAEARARTVADPFPYLLLLDPDDRPIGWVGGGAIPTQGPLGEDVAVPMSPFLDPRTTLKDALSMLLASEVQAGLVVDPQQRLVGMITVDQIAATLRST
jgi:osmoprotectant transport system ATP-binding protein